MKRVFFLAAAALGLFLLGRAIVHTFASDETKIRWVIEEMAEGFDETRMDPVLRGLARDFLDESSGAGRQEVREALAYLFFTAKDERTKAFPYRAEVAIERIEIQEDAQPPEAVSEMTVRFHDSRSKSDPIAWEIGVTARWLRDEGRWTIRRATHTTRSGRMLR